METLTSALQFHRPPPITLGSGRTSLSDKFCAVMHGLWLDTGSAVSLASLCDSVCSITTDLGVEFGLTEVQPAPVKVVLPRVVLSDTDAGQAGLDFSILETAGLDDLPDGLVGEDTLDREIGFHKSLSVPGFPGPLEGHQDPLTGARGPFEGPQGPLKGPRGRFNEPRGPSKEPRGHFERPRGPFKGDWSPLKGPLGSFKRTPGSCERTLVPF